MRSNREERCHLLVAADFSWHSRYTSAKTQEMRGKGGAGDLPCRGARGTLSGGQCEGAPCLSLFPNEVGWLGTRRSWTQSGGHHPPDGVCVALEAGPRCLEGLGHGCRVPMYRARTP